MRSTRPGWLRTLALASLAALFGLPHSGCTPDFAAENESNVILRIVEVEAEEGEEEETGAFLNSDVSPVFNDNAIVTVEVLAKNPNFTSDAPFEAVQVTRYDVNYLRSDGQNREGIDVPYRISGGVTTMVPVGAEADVVFVVVRHQAKIEPPLANLRGPGGVVLTIIAEITLHGRTTSGSSVSARGFLTINFADFADSST